MISARSFTTIKTITMNVNKPSALYFSDCKKSSRIIESKECVIPQSGQYNPVIFLNIQLEPILDPGSMIHAPMITTARIKIKIHLFITSYLFMEIKLIIFFKISIFYRIKKKHYCSF